MKKFFLYCFCLVVFLAKAEEGPLYITGEDISKLSVSSGKKLKWEGSAVRKSQKKGVVLKLKDPEVKIYTPSKKIYIVLDSVDQIEMRGLKKVQVVLSLRKAQVSVRESEGKFQVSLDEGRIYFEKNKGKAEIHSYLAPIHIVEHEGPLRVRSYSSSVRIEKSQGAFNVQSFSSPLYFVQVQGDLNFDSEKSNVQFKRYKGNVKGYTNKGKVSGSFTPDRVQIETGSGAIHLYFAGSKARVEAQSWEGRVLAPGYFYKDRAGGVYKAYGSIRGRGSAEGYAYLKSRSGKISIL